MSDTIDYKGYVIKIKADDDPQDPRDWDNLGKMICFHRSYNLGDYKEAKQYETPSHFLASLLGEDLESEKYDDLHNQHPRMLQKYLLDEVKKSNRYIMLPLYLYDHSGITMSTSSFSCQWDSGQVGWIYISKEDVEKEYSVKDWNDIYHEGKTAKEVAETVLESEVKIYDDYLTGNVYGYTVETKDEEEIESCWGYYGSEGRKEAISEGKAVIDSHIRNTLKKHYERVKNWIKNKVPVMYRQPLVYKTY